MSDDLTPVEYAARIAEVAFPQVDVPAVTPTPTEVATLMQSKLVSAGGGPLSDFTDTSRPSTAQAAGLIGSAVVLVLSSVPVDLPEYVHGRVKEAVKYQAAILIERSFFEDGGQGAQSNVPAWTAILRGGDGKGGLIGAIERAVGDASGAKRGVGSAVIRSTMTDYDPYYPLPVPRQVIEFEPEAD